MASQNAMNAASLSSVPKERWAQIQQELPKILKEIGPTDPKQLAHLPKTAPPELVLAFLARDGAVVVDEVVPSATCDQVLAEMRPYMQDPNLRNYAYEKENAKYMKDPKLQDYETELLGKKTVRVGAIPIRSKASWDVMSQPLVMDVAQGLLGYQLLSLEKPGTLGNLKKPHPWELNVSQMIGVCPGETLQTIHRDRLAIQWLEPLFEAGQLKAEFNTLWAATDFTQANGATNVIPGSHKWPKEEFKHKDLEARFAGQWAFAEMKQGSVLILTPDVVHRAGANVTTDNIRVGVDFSYHLAWLRQQENQYLACPPEHAKSLPRMVQKLIGYELAGQALGYVDDSKNPEEMLEVPVGTLVHAGQNWTPAEAEAWQPPGKASAAAASKL